MLLSIIILLASGILVATIIYVNDRDKIKLIDVMIQTHESYAKIYQIQKEIIDNQHKQQADLISFIDKNIKERVVYTTKDMGYDNVDKLDKEVIETEDEESTEEGVEMSDDQFEMSIKHPPIK